METYFKINIESLLIDAVFFFFKQKIRIQAFAKNGQRILSEIGTLFLTYLANKMDNYD